ncbi:HD domain-containing protein [Chitinophaga agrisoli]|uniref:HD domain-containing protein n=1 Tax=Chitinophaga agrisoli TaxID=2607653 RepID=A0A5B2VKI8_9BACT|nr:HD domain-containing protein [Chitinophaga agrisoli]KAA2239036.1 HD domain-containing protein [Chitinophaga agrisoli]
MEREELLKDMSAYVKGLFTTFANPLLLYHNLAHTQQVVKHAKEIAGHCMVEEELLFVLLTAAWFHDTGHLWGEMATHEERGVKIMQAYCRDKGVDEGAIEVIGQAIMATRMPVKPVTLVEMILCDADTYHLGTPEFRKMDALVWQELELRLQTTFNRKRQFTLRFIEGHNFYTAYCRALLGQQKEENIRLLKAGLPA